MSFKFPLEVSWNCMAEMINGMDGFVDEWTVDGDWWFVGKWMNLN
jgi:hypothetical protein